MNVTLELTWHSRGGASPGAHAQQDRQQPPQHHSTPANSNASRAQHRITKSQLQQLTSLVCDGATAASVLEHVCIRAQGRRGRLPARASPATAASVFQVNHPHKRSHQSHREAPFCDDTLLTEGACQTWLLACTAPVVMPRAPTALAKAPGT
jgi:hypothetical protein